VIQCYHVIVIIWPSYALCTRVLCTHKNSIILRNICIKSRGSEVRMHIICVKCELKSTNPQRRHITVEVICHLLTDTNVSDHERCLLQAFSNGKLFSLWQKSADIACLQSLCIRWASCNTYFYSIFFINNKHGGWQGWIIITVSRWSCALFYMHSLIFIQARGISWCTCLPVWPKGYELVWVLYSIHTH